MKFAVWCFSVWFMYWLSLQAIIIDVFVALISAQVGLWVKPYILFFSYTHCSLKFNFFLLVHFKNMTPFGLVKYWLMKLNDKLMMVFHENESFFRDNSPRGLLWEKVRDHFSGLFCESVIPLSGKYKSFPEKSREFQNPIFCGSHVIVYIWW